jgi:hypothetical protein
VVSLPPIDLIVIQYKVEKWFKLYYIIGLR